MYLSSAGSSGTVTTEVELRGGRQGKRMASGWSVSSGPAEEEDEGLEWDDREEGILLSVSQPS